MSTQWVGHPTGVWGCKFLSGTQQRCSSSYCHSSQTAHNLLYGCIELYFCVFYISYWIILYRIVNAVMNDFFFYRMPSKRISKCHLMQFQHFSCEFFITWNITSLLWVFFITWKLHVIHKVQIFEKLKWVSDSEYTWMVSLPFSRGWIRLWCFHLPVMQLKQSLLCVNDELLMSVFYSFLLQTNHLEKVISILPSIPGSVPLEILKPAMLNATQNANWTEMIIVALSVIPPEKLTELGADVSGLFYLK